ncbi:MAG TPA: BON domain-containing protein [Terriglobales bacterium]|nr:BON domain-containing protein [Terriglobales bacterium]
MRRVVLYSVLLVFCVGMVLQAPKALAATANTGSSTTQVAVTSNGPVMEDYTPPIMAGASPTEVRIAKAVRHQLLTIPLPYYGTFDAIEYSVQDHTVTLSGWVTPVHAWTAHTAVNVVKRIEGVDKVVNNIKVLPTNPLDAQARGQVLRAFLNAGPLAEYFWAISPDIRIIVDNLNLTLTGYVNSEADKNLAGITALNVPSLFQVHNDLQVVK